MKKTKVPKNGINETSLGEGDVINNAGGFIESPFNVDPRSYRWILGLEE